MKVPAIISLFLLSSAAQARSDIWTLSADAWAQPRDGRVVASMAPLPAVIEAWSKRSDRRLVIRYAGGEDGELWASELRSWLVALGVPSANLELVAGSHRPDRIEIELSR